MGFLGLLTLIFVLAKLFGAIAWSWWLVFLPLIISVVINVIIFAGFYRANRKIKRDIGDFFDK